MVIKIFSVQRDRDHVYLAVLAFLEVLSARYADRGHRFPRGVLPSSCWLPLQLLSAWKCAGRRWPPATSSVLAPCSAVAVDGEIALAGFIAFHDQRRAGAAASCFSQSVLFFVMPRLSGGYLSKFAQQNNFTIRLQRQRSSRRYRTHPAIEPGDDARAH